MEIVEPDFNDKDVKSKKIMILISVLIVILMIISGILYFLITTLKAKQFKFIVDGKTMTTYSKDLFVFEGENAYISLKDIAEIVGYKYYNGGYKEYTEDADQCYLESTNEVTTFEWESKKIYKTPTGELDFTYYTLEEPITRKNGKLYISAKDLGVSCNVKITYSKTDNKVIIYTLPYLVNYYFKQYPNAAISTNFNNQKALLYDMLVVQSVNNTEKNQDEKAIRYGVNKLNSQNNDVIIGMKYTNIEFIEGAEEFVVSTEENKVGVVTSDGTSRIEPIYDTLKQIDKDRNLYLASDNKKYGILERNGKKLLYLEFDQIGVDVSKFQTAAIKNKYILFDNAIPVKRDGKYGLYSVSGDQILQLAYTTIGCNPKTSESTSTNSVLVIPEIEGIVFGQEIEVESKKVTHYGVFSSKGKELVPVQLDNIYSVYNSGKEEFTMVYNGGQTYDLIDYVRTWVLPYDNEGQNNNTTVNTNSENTNQIGNNTTANNTIDNQQSQQTVETNANVVNDQTAANNNNQQVNQDNTSNNNQSSMQQEEPRVEVLQ